MSDKRRRPSVTLVSEVTVDGKLTVTRGASSKLLMQFMSHEAEILLHNIRARSDAIMVGANTIRIDNSFLTVRYIEGENPIRVIPSKSADIPLSSNVLSKDAPTIIAVAECASSDKIAALQERGAIIERCGEDKVDLTRLMELLTDRYEVQTLMLEGGSTLNGEMFSLCLIDKIILIHLPFIAGGADTPSLVTGLKTCSVNDLVRLTLIKNYLAGENLISEWQVNER